MVALKWFSSWRRGFAAPFSGLAYLFRHPRTLRYALPPVPIVAALIIGGLALVWSHSGDLVGLLWTMPEGTDAWTTWLWWPLWRLLHITLGLVMSVLVVVLSAVLSIPICGPFMEMLAEQVEHIETGYEAEFDLRLMLRNTFVSLGHALIFTAVGLGLTVLGLLLGLIPILGQILALGLSLTLVPIMLAMTPIDFPLAVRGWSLRDKFLLLKNNLSYVHGFAVANYAFLLVPFVNLLLLPACVVASTRFVLALEAEEDEFVALDRRKTPTPRPSAPSAEADDPVDVAQNLDAQGEAVADELNEPTNDEPEGDA